LRKPADVKSASVKVSRPDPYKERWRYSSVRTKLRMKPSPVVTLLVVVRLEAIVGSGAAKGKIVLVRFQAMVTGEARAKVIAKEARDIGRESIVVEVQVEALLGTGSERAEVQKACENDSEQQE